MISETITIVRGDDHEHEITFVDVDDSTGIETPLDLTGATVALTVKKNPADPQSKAIFSVSTATHTNAAQGETKIVLTPTETSISGEFYYDLQITFPNGKIKSVNKGKYIIDQDVTT